MSKNICVIGLGYIGLPTLLLFAKKNFKILGIDNNIDVINKILDYKNIKTEDNIQKLLASLIKKKNISLSKNYLSAKNFNTFIICVPTPVIKKNNLLKADLRNLMQVVDELKKIIKKNDTVIIESTVPVGTTDKIKKILINDKLKENDIKIAYCPERVLPGNIINELISNDRIVGGINVESNKTIKEIYKNFVKGKIYTTNSRTAEMIKLTENSFRDVNIAFANEISMLSSKLDIDVNEVIKLSNKHPRVNILNSGIGVGGHCIPVDPWFLISQNKTAKLLLTARQVNENKTLFVIKDIEKKIMEYKQKFKKTPKISLMGITYKKDVDDIRNSPSLEIYNSLRKKYKTIFLVDPFIDKYKNIQITNPKFAIKNSQIIIMLIDHSAFIKVISKKNLKNKIFLDYCNFKYFN